MPSYALTAINVGSFALGESDKVLTLFSAERGLSKGVAKGARKPGTKIAGRADLLAVNTLMMATGRSIDIITQAETVEAFPSLRKDLVKLSYGLYFAELTTTFGQGLEEDSAFYFEQLLKALRLLNAEVDDPALLCLEFELFLLDLLGDNPELKFCVGCRDALTDYSVSAFDHDSGGITCQSCHAKSQSVSERNSSARVSENSGTPGEYERTRTFTTHITPLVWKRLVLASTQFEAHIDERRPASNEVLKRATQAGRRLIQSYIEHRAGRRMKSLDLIKAI
jgi:DNA repair protein RecO (recombination protein O)